MEKISGELKQAEAKKEALFKAYEQVRSQASSILLLTLQWKDMEQHLDGIRGSLECRRAELEAGERSLVERARDVAEREEGLRSAWRGVEECEEEVRRKKMDLRSMEERLEECRDEHRKKEGELAAAREALGECNSLIRDKEKELSSLVQATEKCRRDYDSKKEEVEVLRRELDSKEKKVGLVQSLLQENARELDAKVEELGSLERLLDECSRAVESTREELTKLQSLVDRRLKAHDESEKRLSILERTIEEHDKEVAVKAGQLQSLKDKIKVCQTEFKVKEEELKGICKSIEGHSKQLESKESQLHSINILIGEHKEELKSKESELEDMIKGVKQCKEETESKKENIASVQAKLEEIAKALQLKSGEFNAVQASIEDCNLELASKKRQLMSIQIDISQHAEQLRLKEQEYAFIETSTLKCAKALESKKKQCDLMQKSITECSQELESKATQLDSIQKRNRECCTDLELKEKKLCKLDMSIGEHSQVLEMKKKECNEQCMELELGRQQLDSIKMSIEKHSRELELRERTSGHSRVMAQNWKYPYGPVLTSCLNSQSTTAFDGKNLQMFVYRHFQELDRVRHKVLEIIQTSADAAELVLDAMEGFYPQDLRNRDELLDIGMIRRSCIFLLENLIQSSVEIEPQEREAAMKLAVEWKGKLKFSPSLEHPLEVLGYLKLLEAYNLASAFNANEIHDLVNSVSQFQGAQDLEQVLGSSAAPPGYLGSIQHWQIKTEEPENFAVHNANDSSAVNPPPPTVSARKDLQLSQTELLNENAKISKEISDTLQNSSDPAKLVLDVFVGSYTRYSSSKDMNLEADVMRSQIVMLEQLVRISPSITHEVKEGAMKLAREWKAKLSDKPGSALEVLAFQHFLAAYNLVFLLNDSEIMKLGETVSQNNDAPLLGQTLGLVNEITGHLDILLVHGNIRCTLIHPESGTFHFR